MDRGPIINQPEYDPLNADVGEVHTDTFGAEMDVMNLQGTDRISLSELFAEEQRNTRDWHGKNDAED